MGSKNGVTLREEEYFSVNLILAVSIRNNLQPPLSCGYTFCNTVVIIQFNGAFKSWSPVLDNETIW